MVKMFYTVKEAAERLGTTEEGLKDLVRAGKLREFRDADTFNYKIEDVDELAGPSAPDSRDAGGATPPAGEDIVLEPAEPIEDSSVELAPSGSDILSLEEVDLEDSAAGTGTGTGTAASKKAKEDTVVPSVGVNVFDDDDLDEHVDPLAQTAVTDVAGLGMEGTGSGSGILDLTRESDDTSLGDELLEEIYSGEEEGTIEMGEKTRAGLDEAIPEGTTEAEEELEAEAEVEAEDKTGTGVEPAPAPPRAVVKEVVEYGPDAVSTSLTALMAVAVVVMLFAGLGSAALVRGITPALLESVYAKLWMYAAGALGTAVIAAAATYFLAKRSS
ncbi:MAG: hypothetical protein WBE26_20585 [Phycisphaerae bacterium]